MKIRVSLFGIAIGVCAAASAQAQVPTGAGPYYAVTDRNPYPKPAVPALGPAGTTITDPVFQSPITRMTDPYTRPGFLNYSYRTPSSAHQHAWSAAGSYFYVLTDDGTPIPFRFNASTGTASRINPTAYGDGGLTVPSYIEPQFSYVTDTVIYGAYNGPGNDLHQISQFDLSTGVSTPIIDLETLVSGLAGTYVGGIQSSAGPTERIETFFGGVSQDHHHYVVVFNRATPSSTLLLDTWASTLNGVPTPITLNFSLHDVNIDLSGRYVMLYPSSADLTGPRQASQDYLWDTQTGSIVAMTNAMHPYGHDAFGYGVMVNEDCCTSTSWDAAQWQFRSMSNPTVTRDVLPTVLTPEEIYLSDHSTWNDASPTALVPFISGTYRYGNNTAPWRAFDDEIIAVETDVPGANPTIWRFAHHRSNVTSDTNAMAESFWYEPRPNVSPDGQWVLFTSNWEKTLGTDPDGDSSSMARQDVFLVQLRTTGVPLGTPGSMPTSAPAATSGCVTPDPFMAIGGGACVNGGWIPAGMESTASASTSSDPVTDPLPPSTSSPTCSTPDPFMAIGGGSCVNGGWIPAGMSAPTSSTSSASTSSTPASSTTVVVTSSASSSAGCTIPDPFVSIGGGTCVNGGWIPGHVSITPTSSSSSGTSTSGTPAPTFGGCTIPDPFVSIGGGLCVNGGWIPKQ